MQRALIGVAPAHCVYVGDAERDIQAGRAAGMTTVVAAYGYISDDDDPASWQPTGIIARARRAARVGRRRGRARRRRATRDERVAAARRPGRGDRRRRVRRIGWLHRAAAGRTRSSSSSTVARAEIRSAADIGARARAGTRACARDGCAPASTPSPGTRCAATARCSCSSRDRCWASSRKLAVEQSRRAREGGASRCSHRCARRCRRTHEQIARIEKERAESFGALRNSIESVTLGQQALQRETRNLVTALRRPEVRGQWGEMTLRRLAELAGMVEHCDFVGAGASCRARTARCGRT